MNIIGALIVAWILTIFGFDHIFIGGMKEIFRLDITVNGYYFIFFLVGLVMDLTEAIFREEKVIVKSVGQQPERKGDLLPPPNTRGSVDKKD